MSKKRNLDTLNYVNEYELETIRMSNAVNIRSDSPSIEIIKIPSRAKTITTLERFQPEVSSSFRSFVVSPTSRTLREVSVIEEAPYQISILSANQLLPVPKKKPISTSLVSLIVAVVVSLSTILILGMLLSVKKKEDSFISNSIVSAACAPNCMISITPFLETTLASWPLDGSLADLNNVYPCLYTDTSVTTVPYLDGNFGKAMSFSGHYIYSSTHFMNLSYQSWTIEAWLCLGDMSVERGIFGQCHSSTDTNKCLSLSIKNRRLFMSFKNNDLAGMTYLDTIADIWIHVAFVYDYTLKRQLIYLNGIVEATTGPTGIAIEPYQGTTGMITIGKTYTSNIFDGRIDHIQVTNRAKTACEILNDATLTAYYPFDVTDSHLDYSNNNLHGIANALISVTGRVNHAYSFQDEYSYFQSRAFTAYRESEPFSISVWVKPFVVNSGTLIHISTGDNGQSDCCFDLLGFSSTGQLIGHLYDSWSYSCLRNLVTVYNCRGTTTVSGPIMPVNSWTHIVLTYSSANGMALYTNGTLQGVTDSFTSFSHTDYDYETRRPYFTVGNIRKSGSNPTCLSSDPPISAASYKGLIDELRIYSRELTKTEICSLHHV